VKFISAHSSLARVHIRSSKTADWAEGKVKHQTLPVNLGLRWGEKSAPLFGRFTPSKVRGVALRPSKEFSLHDTTSGSNRRLTVNICDIIHSRYLKNVFDVTTLLSSCRWGEAMSLNCGHQQARCSSPRYMSMESHGGMILTGENRKTWRETCPSSTLSTINPTWTDPGVNPGLGGERSGTNGLNHGTAMSPPSLMLILTDGPEVQFLPLLSFPISGPEDRQGRGGEQKNMSPAANPTEVTRLYLVI
jgi:hypothetical protein